MNPNLNQIIQGDCVEVLKTIPSETVDCCVTSPPYWAMRDYGVIGQFGLEKTPEEYIAKMVEVFREVRRVLKNSGTLWLNMGDSYCANSNHTKGQSGFPKNRIRNNQPIYKTNGYRGPGLKGKDLVGMPWMIAFALRGDGWYLRQDIIWHKPNPMPESVSDRCTKAHEYIFLLAKSQKYYFDDEAIKENATYTDNRKDKGRIQYQNRLTKCGVKISDFRNKRSVWTINTKPFKKAHFSTFPEDLILPCILAGCPRGGGSA